MMSAECRFDGWILVSFGSKHKLGPHWRHLTNASANGVRRGDAALCVNPLGCQVIVTKVCRYSWHSAGSLGWPFQVLKYRYIFQIKYAEAILSNSTRKLLWFEITKMLITVYKNKSIVSFIIIFGTLSFPICVHFDFLVRVDHNNTVQRHQVFCSATTSTGIWDVLQHKLSNIARHLRTNDAGMSA